jgi:deazaflavin-dependent oxidoreductase (nitroreductase family)
MREGPGRFRRLLFRAPLLLDRMGVRGLERLMAWACGVEWIVLETIGRRTGRPHTVVLDVVGRDAERDAYYVQPAYGRAARWVRNVVAHPEVTARIGDRVVRARVREATGAEGSKVVLRFIRAHPRYARVVVWFVGYVDRIDRPDDELRSLLAETPVFAVEVV